MTHPSTSEMEALTQPLRTKSDKIRALGRARVPTADIARFLGIRYQFAYNVLRQAGFAIESGTEPVTAPVRTAGPLKTTVDASGRVEVPHAIRTLWNVTAGDELLVSLEGEELRLFTRDAGLRLAQNIVRKYVGADERLSDELIAERRREGAVDNG